MQHPLYLTEVVVTTSSEPVRVALYGHKDVAVICDAPIGLFLRRPLSGEPDEDVLRPSLVGRLPAGAHSFTCLNEIWVQGLPGHGAVEVYVASTRSTAEPKPWEQDT